MTDNNGVIDQIYAGLNSVLGGTNPNQFLTMTVPGTMLNQSDFAYDTTATKPALVAEAESRLVDQMFDVAQVTGSGNGQHVSSQFLQALSVLVPKFNPVMPAMKNRLREFVNSPAPQNSTVEGEPFSGTLRELYFALYESWLRTKSEWDREVIGQKARLGAEAFTEWYEGVAEGRLALIDAAEGRLVSVFSPSDMNAILGALASGPGGDISAAATQTLDVRLPSPSGGYVYPVDLSPSDWFLSLASDQNPTDLLKDPQFIALTLRARQQALQATISQVQALISQVPTTGALAQAAGALSTAQTGYTDAQNALTGQYAANTVTAVQMYLADSSPAADVAGAVAELNEAVASVSGANGDNPVATQATKIGGSPLSQADFQKLLQGQRDLATAQSTLIASAQNLSTAGMNLASEQAQVFGDLPVMLARLQSQLTDITSLQTQLASAVSSPNPAPVPVTPVDQSTLATVTSIIDAARAVPAPADAQTWLVQLHQLTTSADLYPLFLTSIGAYTSACADDVVAAANALDTAGADAQTAAATAGAPPSAATPSAPTPTTDGVKKAVAAALGQGSGTSAQKFVLTGLSALAAWTGTSTVADLLSAIQTWVNTTLGQDTTKARDAAAQAVAATVTEPFPTTAPTASDPDAVSAALKKLTFSTTGLDAQLSAALGTSDAKAKGLSAALSAVTDLAGGYQLEGRNGAPTSAVSPSAAADRWMDLQYSFSSSSMSSDHSQSSLSSQTSWSVDFFFGSAGGSSSSSSSTNSQSYFSTDSTVQIGMKVTKVDVSRAWLDPGVFKLSTDMHRLSQVPVSAGTVDPAAPGTANDALFPCIPVSFVVAKDVTLQFEMNSSQTDAVQQILDSRSAVGGGFLCFSASSSSASHSDSSSLRTKTEGNTVTINMPGPQILGWFCEFVPIDGSTPLSYPQTSAGDELNIIQFVDALKKFGADPTPAGLDADSAHDLHRALPAPRVPQRL
ncbi:hypothetical protein LWF15_24435 [Kineosporia rhizophila]|uniref:hypothetical protein n=1 Tax=Kineosporia TaxID=49184 RepID=UPI001E3525C2|nr:MULTISPECIES: hypothetical protein [Kineosporia]MCE0538651.1 hypothetical protein [Kineosporia rhizophila]GLY20088.1 hypothetical protein Kisp01_71020 [Kineosporia sp. NBRC 101677]